VKRPISVYLGVLLILLRAVTSVVTAVGVALDWHQADVIIEKAVESDAATVSLVVLVALMSIFGVVVVIDLIVARLIFRGSNRARFVAMILATFMVLGSAVDFVVNGTSFTLENGGLLGLSLDILVLVALSSDEARDFAARSIRPVRRRSYAARYRTGSLPDPPGGRTG
jgi:hypothetical protein